MLRSNSIKLQKKSRLFVEQFQKKEKMKNEKHDKLFNR